METLPSHLTGLFVISTAFAVMMLLRAASFRKGLIIILLLLLFASALMSVTEFLQKTDVLPPRMAAVLLPPFLLIALVFSLPRGRRWVNGLNSTYLVLLHTVRVAVEIGLAGLFLHGAVPELMTYHGRNFDILAGLTAPLVYFFGIRKKVLGPLFLFVWNVLGLLLLVNIMVHGILSAPSPFQQFAFEQPNVALLYFPFVWLPGMIVPVVFFSHLALIRQSLGEWEDRLGKQRIVRGER